MDSKKSNTWIVLSLIIVVLFGVISILWNSSLFGKQLPDFVNANLTTLNPVATTVLSGTTEEVVETQEGESVVETESVLETESVQVEGSGQVVQAETPTKTKAKKLSGVSSSGASANAVCGQTEPMFLLGLGIDEQEQADVIRLIRVDFVEKRILMLSIPRDFWVPIPGMSKYNITQFKINAAYGYGEAFFGKGQGVVAFSDTIYQNYGVTFDRYGVFHFSNFVDLINAVGGVDIVLDKPVGAYGITGTTHLDGEAALEYARNREADNDIFRARRQSVIIKALVKKMLLPENIGKLPGLGIKFLNDKTVFTDFTIKDIYSFVCLASKITGDSLVTMEIPPTLYKFGRTNFGRSILLPSLEVKPYIQDLILNGNY